MDQRITTYLKELKQHGIKENIPNVSKIVGEFLNMMILVKSPTNILEIGCANGYSTIWMAEAAQSIGATIHTIDHSAPTYNEAKKNLSEIGLSNVVNFHFGKAEKIITDFPSDLKFDFVFVDGEKASYLDFWGVIKPMLSEKATVIFDDMIKFPHKTKPFEEAIKNEDGFNQLLLPIEEDDGILLLLKK